MRLEQLQKEIGTKQLAEILEANNLQAKSEYADNDPELALIRQAKAAMGDAPASEIKPEKNKKSRKQQTNHDDNANIVLAAAKQRHQVVLTTGVAEGAKDANEYRQGWQLGFVKQHANNMVADAQVFSQQMAALSAAVSNETAIDVTEVLGELPALDPKQLSPASLPQSHEGAGIGFLL